MPATSIDEYLAELDEPKRSTLAGLRAVLLELEPRLTETIGWGAPIFKLNGKNVAGICAFKNHLVYSPQSADVMTSHVDQLAGYVTSKSSFQFPIDQAPPRELIESLLAARIAEIS